MLSEAMWHRLSPLLPPQKPRTGRPAIDHRRFLEAVLWLARTGAPWRDLPPELMNWRTAMQVSPWVDRRFPEPVEAVMARLEAQDHRRFLKAHLPADGLPIS